MSQKHPGVAKSKCPITGAEAKCGIEELRAEVTELRAEAKRLTAAVEKLTSGADLEYYTSVAQQLVSVPGTLERVENLLKAVLAERTEQHEKIRKLEENVKDLDARIRLVESARPPSDSGTIPPTT